MWGALPWAAIPWGGTPTVPEGTPSPITLHLQQKEREDIRILVAFPRMPDGTEVEVLYADQEWFGKPPIPVRLERALEFEGSIQSSFAQAGSGIPQVGSIRIVGNTPLDSDRLDTDVLGTYNWHGARVEVRLGAPHFSFNQFGVIFVGTAADLTRDDIGAEIVVADPSSDLDEPIQPNLYPGDGVEIGGDTRLANRPRPLLYGIARNIEPVLIDRANNVYQFHDGSAEALLEVYERGDAGFTDAGEVADVWAWSPVGGSYVTDLSKGLFRLGAGPAGTITIDAQGDNTGGYVETLADIAERVARKAGLGDDRLDLPSFAQTNIDFAGPVGFYTQGRNPTYRSVLNTLFGQGNPTGLPLGFLSWTRLGELSVGVQKFRSAARTIDGRQIVSLRREETQAAFWEWILGYRRSWRVQSTDDLENASDAQSDFVGQEFRTVRWSDTAVRDSHDKPNRFERNTLIDEEVDAQAEADRGGALTGVDRDFYTMEVVEHQWLLKRGDTVTVANVDAHDIEAGDYLVLSLGENTETGLTRLGLWG